MIEGVDAQARIVSAGEIGVTGAEAGAEDTEVLIALLLKPVKTAADIDDRLAAGGDVAANVGADGVVGALELGGTPNVVKGHGETQRRDAHAVEDPAEDVMAEAVGVPLRHDDNGLLGTRRVFVGGRRIPAGVDEIVLRVGRALGRGKAEILGARQFAVGGSLFDLGIFGERLRADVRGIELRKTLLEAEISGALVAEEEMAIADEELVDADHGLLGRGLVAQDLRAGNSGSKAMRFEEWSDPLETPLEGADDAIFIAGG